MIFHIRVTPGASRNRIIREVNGFKVYLTRPAQKGEANSQLTRLLSDSLHIKKYQIRIIKGEKSRDKLVEINA